MIDTVDTVGKGDGNTRLRSIAFTINNYNDEDLKNLDIVCNGDTVTQYIYGFEVGEKCATPHIQGSIMFKNARSFKSIKKEVGDKWHIEKCKNWKASVKYCAKEGNYKTNIPNMKPIKDPLGGKKPYAWQQEVLDILKEEPDDRKIYWYWEPTGNVGKTALAKSICLKNPKAIVLSGKANDIKYAISQMEEKPEICIFHYTRTIEDYVSYEALEAIKDGMFFNGKYESGMVLFNIPHVIVVANFEPKKENMSDDRWVIREIDSL